MHDRVDHCSESKLLLHSNQDIQLLISLLEDPVFRSIVAMQDSLTELNTQLNRHPSILPGDFDINLLGQLEISVSTVPSKICQELFEDNSEMEDQRVPESLIAHYNNDKSNNQVRFDHNVYI